LGQKEAQVIGGFGIGALMASSQRNDCGPFISDLPYFYSTRAGLWDKHISHLLFSSGMPITALAGEYAASRGGCGDSGREACDMRAVAACAWTMLGSTGDSEPRRCS
jgi:hypothetical protein